jgi:hypothetical protein
MTAVNGIIGNNERSLQVGEDRVASKLESYDMRQGGADAKSKGRVDLLQCPFPDNIPMRAAQHEKRAGPTPCPE